MPGRPETRAVPVLLLLSVLAAQAPAIDLRTQTLRYDVTYMDYSAGELEVRIERNGDQIKTTAIDRLSWLARVFLEPKTVETWFRLREDGAELLRGQTRASKSGEVTGGYEIDRSAGKIRLHNAQDIAVAGDARFAAAGFPVTLMTMDLRHVEGAITHEVSDEKVRLFVYDSVAGETIRIDGKSFNTWKIVRSRRDAATRTVAYWLDRENHNIPVKIIIKKADKETILSLQS